VVIGGLAVAFFVFLDFCLENGDLFNRPGQFRIFGSQAGVLFRLFGLQFGQLFGVAVGNSAVLLRNAGDIEERLTDGCR
jgi:hypothetical protein